jgi:hypothetical protein
VIVLHRKKQMVITALSVSVMKRTGLRC